MIIIQIQIGFYLFLNQLFNLCYCFKYGPLLTNTLAKTVRTGQTSMFNQIYNRTVIIYCTFNTHWNISTCIRTNARVHAGWLTHTHTGVCRKAITRIHFSWFTPVDPLRAFHRVKCSPRLLWKSECGAQVEASLRRTGYSRRAIKERGPSSLFQKLQLNLSSGCDSS